MIRSAPASKPIVTPVAEEEDDEPAATTRLGVGVADVGDDDVLVFDTRGDGFTEDVGVGDTGTTVGLAVAVAVGFGLLCVGVGVGVDVGEGPVPRTWIVPCMLEWTLQWKVKLPAFVNVTE